MATTYQPAGRSNLYVRYKDQDGKWRSKATEWLPGQEREAEAEGRRLEGAAVVVPDAGLTVHAWADRWLDDRSERVRDYENDQSRLEHHVLPTIGHLTLDEVRPAHLVALVDDMKRKGKAARTIRNVYSVIQAMWRDARLMDLTLTDPCILTSRQLGKVQDKDLGWRGDAVFSRAEVLTLVGDDSIPLHRRVLFGLLVLGMLRDGEACGLRWGRVDLDGKPLGRITVVASYDLDTTKTEAERWMPIHPTLNALLTVWRMQGWAAEMGRSPTAEDLVVPAPRPTNRGPRKPVGSMLDKNWIWKRLRAETEGRGWRPRRVHDLRRTGISLAIEDGAEELILKRGTHAPPKNIMGLYTSVSWETLCREVAKVSLTPRDAPTVGPKRRKPLTVGGKRAPRVRARKTPE